MDLTLYDSQGREKAPAPSAGMGIDCFLEGATNQSSGLTTLGSGAEYILNWSSEVYDPYNMHNLAANTDRVVCVQEGTYDATIEVTLNASITTTHEFYVGIMHFNAAGTYLRGHYGTRHITAAAWTTWARCEKTAPIRMKIGDYLQARVYQSSGSTQTMVVAGTATDVTRFSVRLSDPLVSGGVISLPQFTPTWQQFPFQANWSNYADPYSPVMFTKTPDGMVVCKGIAANSVAAGTIGYFPAGFRPPSGKTMIFSCHTGLAGSTYGANGGFALDTRIDGTDGKLSTAVGAAGTALGWLSFTGLRFIAES